MHYFTKYKLTMVKESNNKYEISNIISSPIDVATIATEVLNMREEAEEILALFTLNQKNKVTGLFEVARGSISSAVVHPREILKRALINNAASIVILHNHPSGDPTPSKEDINITNRLKDCCKLIGIDLLDHIIIGDPSFISLKDKGII